MPTFIPARGCTLHLAGVCVNRIGILRTTIIEFEKSPVTRDVIVDCMKKSPDYKEELGQSFLQETAPVAQLPPDAQFAAIVRAYVSYVDAVDRSRGMRRPQHAPIENIELYLKACAANSALRKMRVLYSEGQPIKFERTPYWTYRRLK